MMMSNDNMGINMILKWWYNVDIETYVYDNVTYY